MIAFSRNMDAGSLLPTSRVASMTSSSTPIVTAANSTGHAISLDSTPSLLTLLPRVLKSLFNVILKQATEVDIPDRRIGTFVAYLTSPFALLCILMVSL